MNDNDTTATAPDEPKAETPAADPHPHAHEPAPEAAVPVSEAAAEPVPEDEASVEAVTEPDPEHAPEPEPVAPPELAEVAAFAGEAAAPEAEPAVHEPESEELVPTHEESAPTATEESQDEEEQPAKPAKRPKKSQKVAAAAASVADPESEPAEPTEATEPTGTVEPTEPPEEAKPESKKKWYAIKVQSGREDTIKAAILRKVAIEGIEEHFGQIVIPYEEEIVKKTVRVKDKKTGEYTTQEKKVTRKKKKFQGYLFAELDFNDRILYLFRETSGVGDFLSLRGTPPVPVPMPDHEVQSMLTGERHADPLKKGNAKVKLDFEKGDRVRIRDGSFANQEGEVKLITEPKDPTDTPKVTVVVTLWGRPVDVDLDYWQVEKA